MNVTTTGSAIAIGTSAGNTDGVGVDVTDADKSIFIGASSKPLANSNSNEIVIGFGAVGNGSDTATIGDANVTELHLMKPGAAIALRSPNGTIFKLSVSDAGALVIV